MTAAVITALVSLPVAAQDPDAGSDQRYRGMISSTQITCVAITDQHYGFGNATGGASFHKQEKRAVNFQAFRAHKGAVTAMVPNPDATVLATSGADGAVRCWPVEAILPFNTESEKFAQDGFGRKPDDPKPTLTLTGHAGAVHFLAWDKAGQRLATAGADGTVRLWDAKAGKSLKVLRGHRGAVKGVAFHPDGKWVASAGADKSVRIWDAASGKEVRAITGQAAPLECVAFSADGAQVAAGGGVAGKPGLLKVFDSASGKEQLTLAGHDDVVTGVAFHPAKGRLVSVGRDKTVKTWDLADGRLLYRDKHREPILRLSFSQSGIFLGTASHEVIKFWDGNAEPPGK
jgi:WD40 repeat protein